MSDAALFTLCYPIYDGQQSLFGGQLSAFLGWRHPAASASEREQWLMQGRVRVDGVVQTEDCALSVGQQVSLALPQHREEATDCNWLLVWQNEEIMAVYKPPLLPVSRTTRNLYHTLISLIRRETPYYDAHLLHRLDTETDGLILIAKDKAADRKWKPRLHELIVAKQYLARVAGVPEWQRHEIALPLSERVGSAIRSRMYVVDPQNPELFPKPKDSRTGFEVIAHNQHEALIACELFTGRKHQIRAHLAHLGYPIIGDKIYAHDGAYYLKRLDGPLDAQDWTALGADHHQLSATRLLLQPDPQQLPFAVELPPSLSCAWRGFYKT